jgi:hypothetical protein
VLNGTLVGITRLRAFLPTAHYGGASAVESFLHSLEQVTTLPFSPGFSAFSADFPGTCQWR